MLFPLVSFEGREESDDIALAGHAMANRPRMGPMSYGRRSSRCGSPGRMDGAVHDLPIEVVTQV